MKCSTRKTYQFSSQALLQAGQYSHKRPKLLGSVHSHFPHTQFPLPLQIWPFEFRHCFADCNEHWQRSPSQSAKHLHLPASHSPLPKTSDNLESNAFIKHRKSIFICIYLYCRYLYQTANVVLGLLISFLS